MPTTGVGQWTCAVSNLGFIYIYGSIWVCQPFLKHCAIVGVFSHDCSKCIRICKKKKKKCHLYFESARALGGGHTDILVYTCMNMGFTIPPEQVWAFLNSRTPKQGFWMPLLPPPPPGLLVVNSAISGFVAPCYKAIHVITLFFCFTQESWWSLLGLD